MIRSLIDLQAAGEARPGWTLARIWRGDRELLRRIADRMLRTTATLLETCLAARVGSLRALRDAGELPDPDTAALRTLLWLWKVRRRCEVLERRLARKGVCSSGARRAYLDQFRLLRETIVALEEDWPWQTHEV